MSCFHIEPAGSTVRLRLHGEVGIEHARDLHTALLESIDPRQALVVEAAEATRFDAAALQVLIAAARTAAGAAIASPAPALERAFERYALASPFAPTEPNR